MTNGSKSWVAVAAVALCACGGGAKFAETPMPDAGIVVLAPPPGPAPMADAGAPPAPPPVQAGPCDSVQSLAMSTAIQARAASEAPGMKPEGGAICAIVPEGQAYTGPTFLLQAGHCYTVVGQSLPAVSQIDMQLEIDLSAGGPAVAALGLKPIRAVSTDTGPQAAIGAKTACVDWAFPLPAAVHVVLKARTGSGPVAAQVYSKKR
jgi:hypothetical protein